MAPPQEVSSYRQVAIDASEPKRMRVSATGRSPGSSTSTRASTGAPTSLTNKGSVYKAQRGKAVTAAAIKAKAPTTHRRRGRKGKSVYRGVCVTREGKWRAVIYKERKQLYLGVYESEVDAAKAHDRAARFHFAENAVCNFESEHEADRQALLQQERLLLQQQQLVDESTHHNTQLHGGNFSVGREEFDDLEEYHRSLDEASSEEGEAGEEGDESYDSCTPRTSRSFSTSSSASTGSLSDDYPAQGETRATLAQQQFDPACSRPVAVATVIPPSTGGGSTVGSSLSCDSTVPVANNRNSPGRAGAAGDAVGRGFVAGSVAGDSDGDFSPVSSLLQDLEPTPLEGMGFPYAEDLLGYEMQSFYSCQEDDRSAVDQLEALMPFGSGRQIGGGLMDAPDAVFADLGQIGRQSSTSSMSCSSFSCDDNYVPCALPPLMGMCADP